MPHRRHCWRRPAAALPTGPIGPYQLQAAIAALRDEAPSAETTDWPQIKALYRLLRRVSDNPMVDLNHAVAVAMADGPVAGLRLLDELRDTGGLNQDYRMSAVRAPAGTCRRHRRGPRVLPDGGPPRHQPRYLRAQVARLSRP